MWARFRHRSVPEREVAGRIAVAGIEDLPAPRLLLLDHPFLALRTADPGGLGCRRRGHRLADVLALRISGAADERAEAAAAHGHRLAALLARRYVRVGRGRCRVVGGLVGIARVVAGGVGRARNEATVAAEPKGQSGTTLGAVLIERHAVLLDVRHLAAGALEIAGELVVELAQRGAPLEFAVLDAIQLHFEARGVALVQNVVEAALEESVDDQTQGAGPKPTLLFLGVFALGERREDRGIRGRPADTVLFERLDQRRLAVLRRWLGELLLLLQGQELQPLADLDGRQEVGGRFLLDCPVRKFLSSGASS